jgi:transposase
MKDRYRLSLSFSTNLKEDKKMTVILQTQDSATMGVLYMALELSNKTWKIGFSNGVKQRQVTIEAGDCAMLVEQIGRAKSKLGLSADCVVHSCYEAGRDGFWIHRCLEDLGIINRVVDSSSIEVSRRRRRAKTDRVDVKALLRLLQRYSQGERGLMSVVRVPTLAEEDHRRLHRERERLRKSKKKCCSDSSECFSVRSGAVESIVCGL